MRFHHLMLLSLLFLGGCVHRSPHLPPTPLPPGAPDAARILADLAAHGDAIASLEGTGMVRLKLPGVEGVQNFRTGYIQYQAPDTFFAQGRKPGFLVRVYIEGDRFLLDVPSEKTFYAGSKGDQFDEIGLDVAPSQIFRELFFLDLPQGDSGERVEVVSYDPPSGRATLAVYGRGTSRNVVRQIGVVFIGTWRIESVSIFDGGGHLLAETACSGWEDIDGVPVPTEANAHYPMHGAEMGYKLSTARTRVNPSPPRPMKSLDEALASLAAEGYTEVWGIPPR